MNRIDPENEHDTMITSLKFHPVSDNTYAYGTNRGNLNMSDMRCNKFLKQVHYTIKL